MLRNWLEVRDHGDVLRISFDDMVKYHGRQYVGGVAHVFKVMERAFGLLSPDEPPDRARLSIATAFPGPGGRDGFEMVTRAVTGGRYTVDSALGPPDTLKSPVGRYFFRVAYGAASVDLVLRPGIVREEFVTLAGKAAREQLDDTDAQRLRVLKQEMADRLMNLPADAVYLPVAFVGPAQAGV